MHKNTLQNFQGGASAPLPMTAGAHWSPILVRYITNRKPTGATS